MQNARLVIRFGSRILAGGLALSLSLTGCIPADRSEATSTSGSPAPSGSTRAESGIEGATDAFSTAPCDTILDPYAPPVVNATCGFVEVPLDHDDPSSAKIRIAVSYFDNAMDGPPLMAFLGGPGIGNAGLLGAFVGAPFPVLMMDERGSGSSEPSLDCPELESGFEQRITQPFFYQPALEAYRAALQECRERLAASGVDLGLFGSDQSARDIGIVHRALGFDQVTLLGASYGSRLVLTKLREEPAGVRGVILESPIPIEWDMLESIPTVQSDALLRLFRACQDDELCREAHGDLASVVSEVMERLSAEPLTIDVSRPVGDEKLMMFVDGDVFLYLVVSAMADTSMIPRIPRLISDTYRGDEAAVVTLAELVMENMDPMLPFSEGMNTSVICYEEEPFNEQDALQAAIEDASDLFDPRYFEEAVDDCAIWDIEPAGAVEDAPVHSDVPALIVVGTFDPFTPATNGEMIAANLSNATVIVNPFGGHGSGPSSPCILELIRDFYENPMQELDMSCVEALTGPRFAG